MIHEERGQLKEVSQSARFWLNKNVKRLVFCFLLMFLVAYLMPYIDGAYKIYLWLGACLVFGSAMLYYLFKVACQAMKGEL